VQLKKPLPGTGTWHSLAVKSLTPSFTTASKEREEAHRKPRACFPAWIHLQMKLKRVALEAMSNYKPGVVAGWDFLPYPELLLRLLDLDPGNFQVARAKQMPSLHMCYQQGLHPSRQQKCLHPLHPSINCMRLTVVFFEPHCSATPCKSVSGDQT